MIVYSIFLLEQKFKIVNFNSVKYILLRKVLEVSWKDLNEKLNEAKDMDDIIAANENFLDKIISQLLLDQKSVVTCLNFLSKVFY